MNSKYLGALAMLLMFFNNTHISAHHAFSAEFDQQKRVKVSGTVSEFKWTNPHAWLYIETKDQKRRLVFSSLVPTTPTETTTYRAVELKDR